MSQGDPLGPITSSVGYALKLATSTLRASMERALQPFDLTVPQYACLEQLAQDPGLSNAELARRVFVTRQSMNVVLRGLQERGLLSRPAVAGHGRELPAQLTPRGRNRWRRASTAVHAVEESMLTPLSDAERDRLLVDLQRCAQSLANPPTGM